jgi:hypothetical protein
MRKFWMTLAFVGAVSVLNVPCEGAHQWQGANLTDPAPNGTYSGTMTAFAMGEDLWYILEVQPDIEIWIKKGETGLSSAEETACQLGVAGGGTDSVTISNGQVTSVRAR